MKYSNLVEYFSAYLKDKLAYFSTLEADGQISTILTHNLPTADIEGIINVLGYVREHNDVKLKKEVYSTLGNYIALKSLYSNRNYCKDIEIILNLPQEILPLEDIYSMMKAVCYRKFTVIAKEWKDPLFFSINTFTEYMAPAKWQEFYSYIYYNKMEEKLPYDVVINKRQLNYFFESLVKENKIGQYFSDCNPLKYDNYTLMIAQNDILSKDNKKKLLDKLYQIESKYDKEMIRINMDNPREMYLKSEQRFKSWGEDNAVLPDIEVKELGQSKSKSNVYSDERVRVYANGAVVDENSTLSMEELEKGTNLGEEQDNKMSPSM